MVRLDPQSRRLSVSETVVDRIAVEVSWSMVWSEIGVRMGIAPKFEPISESGFEVKSSSIFESLESLRQPARAKVVAKERAKLKAFFVEEATFTFLNRFLTFCG